MSGNSTKKEKRSRSSSNEGNNSFVKNVTSRMTGMLPATIVKWFSSPSSSSNDMPKSNGSVVTGDATDSSTEDEAPETPVTSQPPAKRMRLSPPATYNHFSPNDTTVSNIEALEPITPYNNTQTTHRAEYNSNYIALHIPKSEVSQEKVEKSSSDAFKPEHSISSASFGSGSRKRKSIFDTPFSTEIKNKAIKQTAINTPRDSMLPTFKPCLLGSPFYSGRTMYGGAAASYINQSNIKERKPTVINETTNRNNTISHSALRVMDLLEQYSSPLSDAKRIPIVSPNRSRENYLSRLESLAQPQSSKSLSYKTQELHVPSIASILRLKQKSRLVNTTNVARQILASHSSTSDQPYVSFSNRKRVSPSKESTAPSHNYTTKIKSRLTRTRRGDIMEDITPEPVNLPTATLQIDQSKLLNFSFGISTASTTRPTTPKTAHSNTKITENTPAATVNDINPYQFSSPSKVSPTSSMVIIKTPDLEQRPKFTFGSPERSVVHANSAERNEQIKPNPMATLNKKNDKAPSKSKDWQCSECWVFNKTEVQKCVCCGGKKPSQYETKLYGSECKISETQKNSEKCVDCDKTPEVNNRWINKENYNSKWKCEDCWVSNDASAEKCLCCGAAKIKTVMPTAALVPNTSTTDEDWKCDDCWIKNKKSVEKCAACGAAKIKTVMPTAALVPNTATTDEDWKCDDCWIKNKKSVEKCAACGNTKPKSKQTAPATTNSTAAPLSSDKTFKGLLKTNSDKWECPNCLVGNDKDRTKCVCCDSAKPGSKKETEKKTFNFDMKTNVTFKFGIDPTIQQNNLSKPVETKTSEIEPKETESEKNNNVLPKTPSFTFGLPTKKFDEQYKPDKVNTVPTMTFTFGVPKSLSAESKSISTSLLTFENKVTEPTKLESNKSAETEKPQEVPKIDFASPTTNMDTKKKEEPKSAILFSTPVRISKVSNDKTAPLVFGALEMTGKTNDSSTSISTVTAKPLTSFTFSGSPAKPASPFGTTAPPSLFDDDKPKTTAPSLFDDEKSKTPAQTTFTLEKTASSSGQLSTANATLFNFGDAVDKPKFNFTFGGQKSEAPPPMFGNTKPDGPAPLFGNTKTDSPAPLFGHPKTDAPASLFSNTKSDAQPSLFGNTAAQKTDAQGPMFGTSKIDTPAPLFGNTKTDAPANLFANTTETNLFSTPNKSEAPVFGVKADSALFGSNSKTNPSLFGNASKSESPLFGNTSKPESALFGNTNKMESPMFKFAGSAETSTGGNKFAGNIFGASPNDATSFGAPQPAAGMFANQKPASFSFGSTPVFGASPPTFGSNIGEPAPMFGSATSTPNNNIFGASAGSAPGSGLFGSPSPAGAPNFGTPNTTRPPYEASSLTPAPAPAFNFGAAQNTGVFGFGQQQQTSQAASGPAGAPAAGGGGVYTFGGGAGAPGAANLQFSLGAGAGAPGIGGPGGPPRRVRKVARRSLR